MSDEIKFDFYKANTLSNKMTECKRCIDEVINALKKELDDVGRWWLGESYVKFNNIYEGSGGVKAILEGISEETTKTGNYLVKITNAKKDFEKNSAKYF